MSDTNHLLSPHTVIDWTYHGKPDALMGTGATRAEKMLTSLGAAAGVSLYVYFAWTNAYVWSWWQYAIAMLLALDVGGGVVANALNSCKRFYFAPLQANETGFTRLAKNHLAFTALHVHPLAIAFVFGANAWTYGIVWYGALVASAFVLPRVPLYLRRPTALLLIFLALLGNYYFIAPVPGFEWFVPALFLKIVYGHLVREEPYRPA